MPRWLAASLFAVLVLALPRASFGEIPGNHLGSCQGEPVEINGSFGPGDVIHGECPSGTVPGVMGTADVHPGGVDGQWQLDFDRATAVAPRGWDESWCTIQSTTILKAGQVGCYAPWEETTSTDEPTPPQKGDRGDSCHVRDNGDGTSDLWCDDGSRTTIKDGQDATGGGGVWSPPSKLFVDLGFASRFHQFYGGRASNATEWGAYVEPRIRLFDEVFLAGEFSFGLIERIRNDTWYQVYRGSIKVRYDLDLGWVGVLALSLGGEAEVIQNVDKLKFVAGGFGGWVQYQLSIFHVRAGYAHARFWQGHEDEVQILRGHKGRVDLGIGLSF